MLSFEPSILILILKPLDIPIHCFWASLVAAIPCAFGYAGRSFLSKSAIGLGPRHKRRHLRMVGNCFFSAPSAPLREPSLLQHLSNRLPVLENRPQSLAHRPIH